MTTFRVLLLALFTAIFVPAGAADPCLDEVKALYEKEWNPFLRKPYRSVQTIYDAEGTVLRIFESVVETPLKTISGLRGGEMGLVIGYETWTAPSVEGPWTKSPVNFPEDREEALKLNYSLELEALSEAVCHGEVELQGRPHLKYEYYIKTAPNPKLGGIWGASRNTLWLDKETRTITQWEQTDFQTSFLPELSKERHVSVFTYDESIKLARPE